MECSDPRELSLPPPGPGGRRPACSADGDQLFRLEDQPSCGLKWAAAPPLRPEEFDPRPIPPRLMDVKVALDDAPPDETSRPGGFRESGLCLAVSGSMHLIVILLLLYFTSYAAGLGGTPGPGPGGMLVGLFEGPGGPLEDGEGESGPDEPGGGEPAAEESAAPEPEAAEIPPVDELEPAWPELEKIAAPPEPDPEAVALEKPESKPEPEPKKAPPPKKNAGKKADPQAKASAPSAKKSEITGRAGQPGSGRGVGGGGEGAGQKGGGGGGGGGRGGGGGTLAGYRKANFNHIVKLIQRKMVYPPEVKKAGITGTAKVAFTIGRNGQAGNIRLAASSGNASLDQAALSAVRRASPFPAPPEPAHITIPLRFSLR